MKTILGDFKPDNILINRTSKEFVLLDPRGRSEVRTLSHDPLYDVAKFLTSTKDYYTAFKTVISSWKFQKKRTSLSSTV